MVNKSHVQKRKIVYWIGHDNTPLNMKLNLKLKKEAGR